MSTRLRPLAKLPVFLDLGGKRAVIAGGSAAAAWKAELLAAAGADVEIYASTLSTEMAALLASGTAAGTISHSGSWWSSQTLVGAVIALADATDDAEAASFSEAARRAGVLCNVIDKPAFCQFQFGSLVNRSPIIVGISTDGTAPILGQAIRRRIEGLLPPSLAAWGQLAKRVRGDVKIKLAAGPQRRAFWERFVERSFGAAPTERSIAELETLATEIASDVQADRGRLTVIDAGSGDADLLTLKGLRALQAAGVIFHDAGASSELLELGRREAARVAIEADCADGRNYSETMKNWAMEGRNVVYLKSEGPTAAAVAEQVIELLSRAGIQTEIVPGVPSAAAIDADRG